MRAEVLDAETTEIAIRDEKPIIDAVPIESIGQQILTMIPQAGTLELDEGKLAVLHEPIDPEIIEIRPDGLIYLPWMEYARRMNNVFGVSWVLVPDDKPKLEGDLVMWGFHLIIKGIYMGYAIGEQEYKRNNPQMSWGDACEGAQSNALTRLCAKRLGIGLELWQPAFIRDWKKQYADSEWRTVKGKNKQFWFRKDGDKHTKSQARPEPHIPESQEPVRKTDGRLEDPAVLLRHIHAFAGDMAIDHSRLHNWCDQQWDDFTGLGNLDAAHLLKLKQSLEKLADSDIQPEHVALIADLAQEAGFESVDGDKFKGYVKKDLRFEFESVEEINGFKGIAIVKKLREVIKALQEAEAAEAEEAEDSTEKAEEIEMDGPADLFPGSNGRSNNPSHKTPEELGQV